jgi:hypothetical protein
MSDEEDRLYEEYGEQMPRPMPESWTDLQAKFEERGEQMPHFRQQDRLRAWRDYLEHWDEPARGVKGPGRGLAQGLGRRGTGPVAQRITYEVTQIWRVNIKRLRKDLKKARKAAGLISEREFDHVYITAAHAAEILGMSLEEFEELDRKPTHLDFVGTSVCATGGTGLRPGGTDDSSRQAGRATFSAD